MAASALAIGTCAEDWLRNVRSRIDLLNGTVSTKNADVVSVTGNVGELEDDLLNH